jgi:menaquinone-specific isochorismate synthase
MLAGDAICLITRPAPRLPAHAFLALDPARFGDARVEGERMLWDDGAEDGWASAGRGAAARVEAWGEGRFRAARESSQRLFASVLDLDRDRALPGPRLFGGASFQPQKARALPPPWTGFADASFVLPRWTYGVSRDGAFVRFAAPAGALRGGEQRVQGVVRALEDAAGAHGENAPRARPRAAARVYEMARPVWDELVQGALQSIRRHELEKVVTARRSAVSLGEPIDLPAALARMKQLEPTCTRFALEREGGVFLGATPERLALLRGLRVEMDALAGSIPRRDGGGGAEIAELRASEKDGREHALVVDGIRAALEPFCVEIDAPRVPEVRSLRAVHHLWTPVRALLRARAHILDLVAAVHPTPAVCGLPRERARGWIAEHEPVPRGWYASPVGWFDAEGEGQFSVAIRSALVKGKGAWLFAGCGIVEGSDPASEYKETSVKQTTMLATLGALP